MLQTGPVQDEPLNHLEQDNTQPQSRPSKPLYEPDQDKSQLHPGQNKLLNQPGQDKLLRQPVQNLSSTTLHRSKPKLSSPDDLQLDQYQANQSKYPQPEPHNKDNEGFQNQTPHTKDSSHTYQESEWTKHEQRDITSALHSQESTKQSDHKQTKNEQETKEQVQDVLKSLPSQTEATIQQTDSFNKSQQDKISVQSDQDKPTEFHQEKITKPTQDTTSPNVSTDESTPQSNQDKSTSIPKNDNGNSHPNQIKLETLPDHEKPVTKSDQGKTDTKVDANNPAYKPGQDESSILPHQDKLTRLPKSDETTKLEPKTNEDRPLVIPKQNIPILNSHETIPTIQLVYTKSQKDKPHLSETLQKANQDKPLSINKPLIKSDNDKDNINKLNLNENTTKAPEDISVIKPDQTESTCNKSKPSSHKPMSDQDTPAINIGDKRTPATPYTDKLASEPKQDNPDKVAITTTGQNKPATIQGKPILQSIQDKSSKQPDQDYVTIKPATEPSDEPTNEPVQEPKTTEIPDQNKCKAESAQKEPMKQPHQEVVKTNIIKPNTMKPPTKPDQEPNLAVVPEKAKPTDSTENKQSRQPNQDVPKFAPKPDQVATTQKPNLEPLPRAIPNVDKPAINAKQDKLDQSLMKSNDNQSKHKTDEEQPIVTRKHPNFKKPYSTNGDEGLQSQNSEDTAQITRSNSWSERDSYSERRGRYDLSRSSSIHGVQQAIETEVNYKTLVVSDGSNSGRCYCSCDINSKPVFISLDQLRGWPTL
ncbi:enolase-phosphatase E1-like [Manduca sexta]|uniref:enolase-phosphatase E1-like n=1 Tax=Manduca sexta TaxID=7130 RepID=UPI00188DE435|nr:enolase-phosphatase E1-like [Manduca sexta]